DKKFNFVSNLYSSAEVSKYSENSSIILFYIIREFQQLLEFNNSGNLRNNVAYFLIEFIDRAFSLFNNEYMYTNNDIRKFIHVLNSIGYVHEMESTINQTDGLYEETVEDEEETQEDIEAKIDLEEELDALDMDDADIEEGYES